MQVGRQVAGHNDRYIIHHPLYPWVDPRNRRGTGHCRRRPGLPVSSALLLAGSSAMACCFPRGHASLLPRRVSVFSQDSSFYATGSFGGKCVKIRLRPWSQVRLSFSIFFVLFCFFGPFSFHAKLNTLRNTAGDQKQHERERERERERGKCGRERKRQMRQREVTVRRVFDKAKKSLSLHTQSGMDFQGSKQNICIVLGDVLMYVFCKNQSE